MPIKKPTTDRAILSSIHDGLIHHPDLAQRFNSILRIANEPSAGGKIRSADEVESLMIEELRKLGNESLVGWAEGVDHRLGEELKQQDSTVKMREKKTLEWWSRFGLVRVCETFWRNPNFSYIRVLTKEIGVHSHRCSLPLQRSISDYGFDKSFKGSAKSILEHLGFEIPLSTVGVVTRQHAEKIAQRQQAACANANALPAVGVAELVAEADGSFIRIVSTTDANADARKTRRVDYKEARLFASSAQGSSFVCYDATFGAVDTGAALWAQTAKSVGMSIESYVQVVADGARWIDSQRLVAFGVQSKMLIDLYHVLEYIGAASEACSDKAERWVKTQKKRLKTGRSHQVITELKKHIEPENLPDEVCPVRCAWRYLENRSDYLAYDKAIEKEMPLGSGLIESGNKHVLQARMKIPGASWSMQTAENFARARAMRANDQWNTYWDELFEAA